MSPQIARELLICLRKDSSKLKYLVMFVKLVCAQLADNYGMTELNVTKVKMLPFRCRVLAMGLQVKRIGVLNVNLHLKKLMDACI